MTVTVATPTAREELPARLRRVTMRLSRRLRREAGSGLPPALDSALTTIGRRGPISPSELAQLEGVRRPTRRDAYIARRLASFEPDDRAMLDRALALLERMITEER